MSRDPADIIERRQERELGCWLCQHSRADREKIACAQRHIVAQAAQERKFPLAGAACIEFRRRPDM